MANQPKFEEPRQITFDEVSNAIDVVGILLDQISIPASRAQEFALLNSTLADLKAFVNAQVAQSKPLEPLVDAASEVAEPASK